MIKLERECKPTYLTDEKVKELTERFKANRKASVWKHHDIENALLKSSSSKCAYCECELQKEDSYMQIEHFKDKDTYPDDVVVWENLLPSCQRCNRKKWTLDVILNPIVNPFDDYPAKHICHEAYRLYGKDEKGTTTINKLFLNDDDKLVLSRFRAGNEVARQLTNILNNIANLDDARNSLTSLLQSCQPDKPYTAFVSSTLHNNPDYLSIKTRLQDAKLWDEDMDFLDKISLSHVLERR